MVSLSSNNFIDPQAYIEKYICIHVIEFRPVNNFSRKFLIFRLYCAFLVTYWGRLAQMDRAPARHAGGQRFKSSTAHLISSCLSIFYVHIPSWPLSYRLILWQFAFLLWQQPCRTIPLGPADSVLLRPWCHAQSRQIPHIVNIVELSQSRSFSTEP